MLNFIERKVSQRFAVGQIKLYSLVNKTLGENTIYQILMILIDRSSSDWFGRWGTSVFSENTAIFINRYGANAGDDREPHRYKFAIELQIFCQCFHLLLIPEKPL